MLIRRVLGWVLATFLALSHVLSGVVTAQQIEDRENPVLIHRQADTPGIAGELQTFLARVYDDVEVVGVTLYYRQSDNSEFDSIAMRPLLDSLGEYMIAIETNIGEYPGLQYYIEAVDSAGNVTNRGFSYAPIILPLDVPETVPAVVENEPEPGLAERVESDSRFSMSTVLLGAGALLLLGALASGGGDNSGADNSGGGTSGGGATSSPDTVTLTIISDPP